MASSAAVPEPIYTAPPSTTPTSPPPTTANISIREYIYFLPHPLPSTTPVPYTPNLPATNPLNLPPTPFEPTNTLVLTSPNKTFIDLRYLKPTSPHETPLPNAGEPGRLEWGFAGTSSSDAVAIPHPELGAYAHSVWTHWLDSRVAVGEDVDVDEGDMYDLGNGLFLEHGHAWHPHLGRVAGHEELWRDVPIKSSGEGAEAGRGKVCVVLRCEDGEKGVRGVVVRVGAFCQGIVQYGGATTTERWEFGTEDERDVEDEKKWKRTARTGDAFLPCAVAFRDEVVRMGGRVRYGGLEWVVEEVWVWN